MLVLQGVVATIRLSHPSYFHIKSLTFSSQQIDNYSVISKHAMELSEVLSGRSAPLAQWVEPQAM